MEGERGDSLPLPQDALGLGLQPLSLTETREFIEMLQLEGLANVSPCEPCEVGYGGERPHGPLTFAEAVLTA